MNESNFTPRSENGPDPLAFTSFDQFRKDHIYGVVMTNPAIKGKIEEIKKLIKDEAGEKEAFEAEIEALSKEPSEIRLKIREQIEQEEGEITKLKLLIVEILSSCQERGSEIYLSNLSEEKKREFSDLWFALKDTFGHLKNWATLDEIVAKDYVSRANEIILKLEEFDIHEQVFLKARKFSQEWINVKYPESGIEMSDPLLINPRDVDYEAYVKDPASLPVNTLILNPEMIDFDFEKAEFLVVKLPEMHGKRIFEVLEYIAQKYSRDYLIPGAECHLWFKANPQRKNAGILFGRDYLEVGSSDYLYNFLFAGSIAHLNQKGKDEIKAFLYNIGDTVDKKDRMDNLSEGELETWWEPGMEIILIKRQHE
ncbi:MAG: hypothetical protein V4664_03500 [Patescibacteria group bacterium]